jgi:hypothetical protein
MYGPVHYGDVAVDAQGDLAGDASLDKESDAPR